MIHVLDHGYVRFIESWGHGEAGEAEAAIIEAARQSTQGAFRGWDSDRKLLRYLYTHKHSGPFEFAGMTIEVQAPIFVFREWHRHRTQSFNEMSARYAPLPDLYYVPTVDRILSGGGHLTGNAQAAGIAGAPLATQEVAERYLADLREDYARFQRRYEWALANGVPKEVARIGMPVGHYSRMRATGNLRNWLGFLTLRLDPAAQWEIRQFAAAVGAIVEEQFPRTWTLFRSS